MRVADGKSYEAKGIGQVTLKTKYGQLVLKNVLFIPEFTTNLISNSTYETRYFPCIQKQENAPVPKWNKNSRSQCQARSIKTKC